MKDVRLQNIDDVFVCLNVTITTTLFIGMKQVIIRSYLSGLRELP